MRTVTGTLLLWAVAWTAPACADAPAEKPEAQQNPQLQRVLTKFFQRQYDKKEEKKCAELLATLIIESAHPSGTSPGLKKYEFSTPKGGTVVATLSVEYYGALTQQQYTASICVTVDVSNPRAFEIQDLTFRDSNNILPPNKKNLADLRKRLNTLTD